MEEFIKAKYLFSEEKIKDCLSTNTVQKTLREQVQDLNLRIQELEEQNKMALGRIDLYDNGGNDSAVNNDKKEEDLKSVNVNLEEEKKQLLDEVKTLRQKLGETTKKLNSAQQREESFKNYYDPKLKSTIEYHKTLQDGLNQIKEDTQLLPRIFRAEAEDRKNIKAAQEKAEQDAEVARAMRRNLEARIDDLTKERDRRKQLALQAIAARQNIKSYLDEEKMKVQELQQKMEIMKQELQQAEDEKFEF